MDNLYFNYGCPPLVQDSRFLTTYLHPRWLDQDIRKQHNIYNSDNYRKFIQDNGEEFIKNEFKTLMLANNCITLTKP